VRAASARVQSHPPASTPPRPNANTIENGPPRPAFKAEPEPPVREPGRKRTPAPEQPKPEASEQTDSANSEEKPRPPAAKAPSAEEVENDPLVKSVLDVFGGEIKRIHPKNQ